MTERLIVYDSYFGNTEKIAQAIGEILEDAAVKKVYDLEQTDLDGVQILIVGSPTRAFRPSPAIMNFIKRLTADQLQGVKAAAFDTRIQKNQDIPGILRLMINLFGYADVKIAKVLSKAGANLALKSTGFGVKDTEGPLVDGELARAKEWAEKIM